MKLRASSLPRLALCPASYHLSQNAPALPESDDATRGSKIHAWLAGEKVDLSPDEQDDASECLAILDNLTMRLPEPDEILTEQEMSLDVDGVTITGHVDRVEIRGAHALLVDFKTGRNEVELAESNAQLGAYSLMLAASRGDIEEFTLAIIQPHARNGGSQATFRRAELVGYWRRVCEVIRAIRAAETGPQPGVEQCRYCPAAPLCPAMRRELATVDKADLSPARWETYAPEDKLALYDLCSRVLKAAGVIHSLIKSELAANPNMYGGALCLKPGTIRTTITDAAGLYGRLVQECGLTAEEFLPCVSVAKTKLAPVVKAKSGRKGKAFDDWLSAVLAPHSESKQCEPSIERRRA